MRVRRIRLLVALGLLMAVTLATGLLVGRTPPAGTGTGWGSAEPEVRAVMWPEPLPLADVTLETQHGETFTPTDLHGRWSLMFFGYLGCPDVCPTSLSAMREMRRLLEASKLGGDLQYYFVSVDPANDDPADMVDYLAGFDPSFIGLHGPEPEIRRLTDSMAVKFEPFVNDGGYTTIDHTSSVMMIDSGGRMVGALPPPLVPEQMVHRYLQLRDHLQNAP